MQAEAQRRDQIIDAAFEVFAEKGFHHATVADVAERAHVGKGTVYLYFAGKEALLDSIFDTLIDRLLCAFDQTLSEDSDPRQAVQQWVARQLIGRRAERLIPQLLALQPFLSGVALQTERGIVLSRAVGRVAAGIQAGIDGGRLRAVDATLIACLLLSLPAAIPLYRVARPNVNLPAAIPDIAEGVIDILWSGLRKECV